MIKRMKKKKNNKYENIYLPPQSVLEIRELLVAGRKNKLKT